MMAYDLEVGQELWYVPSYRGGEGHPVKIQRVARKWAYLEGSYRPERISIDTLTVDGGEYSSPGQCYISKEVYEQQQEIKKEWADLVRRLSHIPNQNVTIEDIRQARRLLGVDE